MKRRTFLHELAAWAAATGLAGRARADARTRRVVVIGAGIVGAAIAFRLARRGARVTVLDKTGPAAGATSRSFAWMNADVSKRPRHYHDLNRLGLWSYRVLAQDLPGLPVQWGGALQWQSEAGAAEDLRRRVREQQEWGYPIRLLESRELRALEPELRIDGARAIAFAEQEGFLDPAATTRRLLDAAVSAGAELHAPCEVTGLDVHAHGATTVRSSCGDITADVVVVAAGVSTPSIAAMAGVSVPLVPAPGLLVHTPSLPPRLQRVVIGPAAHIKQYRDGRAVIGDDLGPPASPAHEPLAAQPTDFPDEPIRTIHAQRLLREASQYLPALASAPVDRVTVGWRPMPKDGYPIVGPSRECPSLYLVVTHSGVTLAPVLSEYAAIEILDEVEVEALEPYRLARFVAG